MNRGPQVVFYLQRPLSCWLILNFALRSVQRSTANQQLYKLQTSQLGSETQMTCWSLQSVCEQQECVYRLLFLFRYQETVIRGQKLVVSVVSGGSVLRTSRPVAVCSRTQSCGEFRFGSGLLELNSPEQQQQV